MSWDGGSGYRIYVFEESIRRYAIDRKGRGRKDLRVADVSCTRSVRESTGLSYRAPAVGFRDKAYILLLVYTYYNNIKMY